MASEEPTLRSAELPRLVVRLPDGKEVTHYLVGKEITIGRDPSNRICIPDHFVSKHHAKLLQTGRTYTVADLGSANKTRVNGQVVTQASVHFGDQVQFAGVKCRLLEPEARSKPAAPPAEPRAPAPPAPAPAPAARAAPAAATPRPSPAPARPAGSPRPAPPVRTGRSPMFRMYLFGGVLVFFALVAALLLRAVLPPPDGGSTAAPQSEARPVPVPAETAPPLAPDALPVGTEAATAAEPPSRPAAAPAEARSVDFYFDEALSLIDAGRLREARANFVKVLELDPANARAKSRLALLEEQIEKAIEEHFTNARQAFNFLRYDEAIAEWELVLALAEASDTRYAEAQEGIERARQRRN